MVYRTTKRHGACKGFSMLWTNLVVQCVQLQLKANVYIAFSNGRSWRWWWKAREARRDVMNCITGCHGTHFHLFLKALVVLHLVVKKKRESLREFRTCLLLHAHSWLHAKTQQIVMLAIHHTYKSMEMSIFISFGDCLGPLRATNEKYDLLFQSFGSVFMPLGVICLEIMNPKNSF